MYLLDANVLIDANRDFYRLDAVPEFWDWLLFQAQDEQVKIPHEIYGELTTGDFPLDNWLRDRARRSLLELDEEVHLETFQHVINNGYALDLTDNEVAALGRDPFLIAYALADAANRIVVTTEGSKPTATRANKHVPDVCDALGAQKLHAFDFYRVLNFRTNWRQRGN